MYNLTHLQSDVLHYGALDTFWCFPCENMMRLFECNVHRPRNPAQHLHRRICEAAVAECGTPMTRFRERSSPCIFRRTLLSCTAFINVAIVCRRSACVTSKMDDEVGSKFFRNPTDLFTYPMHFIHLYIFCGVGLEEDVITVPLVDVT